MKKLKFRRSLILNPEPVARRVSHHLYLLHIDFVMNVFPLIISLACIIHKISSHPQRKINSEYPEESHLWSQCYDDLGCINNTEEWYDRVLRPIEDQPLPRNIIKTTFILFNKGEDPRHIVTVEPLWPISAQIRATKFDKNFSKIHLLIHDFTSNGMAGWIKHTVKSLLEINAGNIISVDWTAGAEPPYSIAVQNARLVALEVVNLVQTLLNEFVEVSPEKFYLIGHGVGAHIAGYVGQKINGIGRITGLDPVGLYFKDMPSSTRLDPKDAKFVDIINTDIGTNHGQGSGDPYGHLNFFPNGGLTQIGCNLSSLYPNYNQISRDMIKEGQTAPGCNHKRAAKYFTASIDERYNKCTLMGYACSNYPAFKRGECVGECKEGSTCSIMGYSADVVAKNLTPVSTTKFFLDTNDRHPYCLFAYKIIIALAWPRDESVIVGENKLRNKISGMFCATFLSDSEGLMFRTNLELGMGEEGLNVEGDNVFLTYQKQKNITEPDRVLLRLESEDNETTAYVRHVKISNLPDYGNSVITHLCGKEDITLFKNHLQADFTRCDKSRFGNEEPATTVEIPLRQRRNPDEKSTASETLEVSDYDDGEIPVPPEDDYYTNR